jgi:hypothetical protein
MTDCCFYLDKARATFDEGTFEPPNPQQRAVRDSIGVRHRRGSVRPCMMTRCKSCMRFSWITMGASFTGVTAIPYVIHSRHKGSLDCQARRRFGVKGYDRSIFFAYCLVPTRVTSEPVYDHSYWTSEKVQVRSCPNEPTIWITPALVSVKHLLFGLHLSLPQLRNLLFGIHLPLSLSRTSYLDCIYRRVYQGPTIKITSTIASSIVMLLLLDLSCQSSSSS